jgi:hypothetical protein
MKQSETGLNILYRNKHSSLFFMSINDEVKKVLYRWQQVRVALQIIKASKGALRFVRKKMFEHNLFEKLTEYSELILSSKQI